MAAALVASGLSLSTPAFAVTTPDPAITGDPNASNGSIVFHSSSGATITSGSDLSHLFDYAEASTDGRTGATKATVFFAFPDHTQSDSQNWNSSQVTASTTFPNGTYPAPLATDTHPVAKAGSGDADLAALLTTTTTDTTTGYNQIVQVRLFDSGPGVPIQTAPFWATDIYYDSVAGTRQQVFPVTATAPGQPTGVSATPGKATLDVSWTAPADGGSAITKYTVTATPDPVTGDPVVSKDVTGTSTTLTGLKNIPYDVTVTATNAIGEGPASTAVSATPLAATAPDAPTGLSATSGNTTLALSWTAPADGGSPITDYSVTYTPDGGSATVVDTTSTGTSYLLTGLTNGTQYTVTVKATNAIGTGADSAGALGTPNPVVPGAPTAVHAVGGDTKATITFSAPADNGGSAITGYTVTASTGQSVSGAASPLVLTGLTNGISRTFTVKATNAVGTGAASAASNAVVFYSSSLSIHASFTTVVAGSTYVKLSGTLTSGPASSKRVVLYSYPAGHAATATAFYTTATGAWAINVKPVYTTSYKLVYAGDASHKAITSALVKVSSRTKIAITSPKSGTRTTTRTLHVVGTTYPAKAGTYVYLYELIGGKMVRLTYARTASNGTFVFTHTFARGTHYLYALVAGTTWNLTNTSARTTLYEV